MQVARVAEVTASAAEIIGVKPSGKVLFGFDCSSCGRCEGHLSLCQDVDSRHLEAMLELAVEAHLRTH